MVETMHPRDYYTQSRAYIVCMIETVHDRGCVLIKTQFDQDTTIQFKTVLIETVYDRDCV